jgi:hypothetical protein
MSLLVLLKVVYLSFAENKFYRILTLWLVSAEQNCKIKRAKLRDSYRKYTSAEL